MKEIRPKKVVPLPEASLVKLEEHHATPVKSREYYFNKKRRQWLKRFENIV